MSSKKVYIADTTSLFPNIYKPEEVVDLLYPKNAGNGRAHRIASLADKRTGIENRPSVLDGTKLPDMELCSEEDSAENWGRKIISRLMKNVSIDETGFLSVSYNVAGPVDNIPNIASRLVSHTGMKTDIPPQEIAFYGCASGVYSLDSAREYCLKYDRASVVFVFDQCSWLMKQIKDPHNPHFKNSLKTNLIFGDGAVGILLIPESMKDSFPENSLMEIEDILLNHVPGDLISIEDGDFILSGKLSGEMPGIVSEGVIEPMFEKHEIKSKNIEEWSIHQGGLPILNSFTKTGSYSLSQKQISASEKMFRKYGNLSSPSAFVVLDDFFKKGKTKQTYGKKGMLVSFGAGYYMGGILYKWA